MHKNTMKPVQVNVTAGQLKKITQTARRFGVTESEMLVALAMGMLAMHGRVAGAGDENADTFGESIRDFVHRGRTPKFGPATLAIRECWINRRSGRATV